MYDDDLPPEISLNPRTALAAQSIWRDLPENAFRTHLVQLEERTNSVPCEPQVFIVDDKHENFRNSLPNTVEKQLADDFAFLAAAEEGAQSVAACCIEENGSGMTVRFAITDSKYGPPISGLQSVFDRLSNWVNDHSSLESERVWYASGLFLDIIKFHDRRIISRLRSKRWVKPKYLSESHKKPLWKDFENVIHRAQFLYTKKEARAKKSIQDKLQGLANLYEAFEGVGWNAGETTIQESDHLHVLIRQTFNLCVLPEMKFFLDKLESVGVTAQVASALKCVRQIEKIGAYYRITQSLIKTAKEYPGLFYKIKPVYLNPYASVPTSISFESWAKSSHVHAEVQLVVHYDFLRSGSRRGGYPRVIGTSKHMCFLCYLFIEMHGYFHISNTHGRLYDQWTIPDLAQFNEDQQSKFRAIIKDMDDVVVEWCKREPKWRAEPMTSRQNLVDGGIELNTLVEIAPPRDTEDVRAAVYTELRRKA